VLARSESKENALQKILINVIRRTWISKNEHRKEKEDCVITHNLLLYFSDENIN